MDRFGDIKTILEFLELIWLPFSLGNTVVFDLLIFYLGLVHLCFKLWFCMSFLLCMILAWLWCWDFMLKSLVLGSLLNVLALAGRDWELAASRAWVVWPHGAPPCVFAAQYLVRSLGPSAGVSSPTPWLADSSHSASIMPWCSLSLCCGPQCLLQAVGVILGLTFDSLCKSSLACLPVPDNRCFISFIQFCSSLCQQSLAW